MIWQDIVLFLIGCINAVFLIPTLRSKFKPPLETSIPITCTTVTKSFVLYSLGLYASGSIYILTAILWFFLTFQKWKIKKNHSVHQ